jgi:hypothetical protein
MSAAQEKQNKRVETFLSDGIQTQDLSSYDGNKPVVLTS